MFQVILKQNSKGTFDNSSTICLFRKYNSKIHLLCKTNLA